MDIEKIIKIMDRFDQSNMTSFSYEDDDISLSMESKKEVVVAAEASVGISATGQQQVIKQTEKEEVVSAEDGTIITSALVGTFYAAKAEGEKPFVSVGDKVNKGQTIGIIEAMKLMNEIEAEVDGTVAEIYVENEQLVEFGQPIIRLV